MDCACTNWVEYGLGPLRVASQQQVFAEIFRQILIIDQDTTGYEVSVGCLKASLAYIMTVHWQFEFKPNYVLNAA